MDISTGMFLGTSMKILSSAESAINEGQQFAEAFDYAQRAVSGIDDLNLLNFFTKLIIGDRRLKKSLQSIHSFIDNTLQRMINSHTAQLGQARMEQDGEKSFFQALLGEGRTKEDMRCDILGIMLAGRDSMTSLLSSTWYLLSKHPQVFRRLRDEFSVLNGRQPTKADLNSFPYLRMVNQEGRPCGGQHFSASSRQ
ncbi:hypothetical protein AJ79_10247 [Helicocarpus griseus UAMH5409]|uniref:Uncharacterized protein n=1 Tax=Helicocarpus griseus UAMH5409 TaxID=1447875 RepID=A0A2B7WES8_9EURO|nr:hypothetical protein AJ79_10247 [Helicocarpus griseus UAMH5409]